MKRAAVGILAHVDAGKTTLAEALLYHTGAIRARGRVDHGNSHLDTDELERSRGITIFSSQVQIVYEDTCITLLDTPGHVDFCAEAERVLPALDCAVLLLGANDGVTGHTSTLWRLLERYQVPTVVFINKMDLASESQEELMGQLTARLSDGCIDACDLTTPQWHESLAATDEGALDEYLDQGFVDLHTAQRLVRERKIFPCLFGSALRDEGVLEFLDKLCLLIPELTWPESFSARAFKVTHEKGERLVWLKVTGGRLCAKDLLEGTTTQGPWAEKVNQIRIYQGAKYDVVGEAEAGQVCAVTGLSQARPGDALGEEAPLPQPSLVPVLTYRVEQHDLDAHAIYSALSVLADEDPMLGVTWDPQLEEIRVQLMGAVQLEVVRDRLLQRLGQSVDFGLGSILYKESISKTTMGYGHYEPLKHYAEAHLRIEPLPAGSGVVYGTVCSTDDLDLNWQRLILSQAMEREHKGVLVGSPITDVRITLVSGRAHVKHTEGGDFRQAAWRAIRQGLMTARQEGHAVLLEPWYRFSLEVPEEKIGRALADVTRMHARFTAPEIRAGMALIEGDVPASEVGDYALDVVAYTSGNGSFTCEFLGYEPCHDAERVVAEKAYDPEADLANTADSVFCSHGAGYTVKWYEASERMHVTDDKTRERPWRVADASFFSHERLRGNEH